MKKILLSIALVAGVGIQSYAQEPYPCHTDQKRLEFIENLSPSERQQFLEEEENYNQRMQEFIAQNPQLISANSERGTIKYTIPVVFHILHEGGPENISVEQVEDAVRHMNLDYQLMNDDSDDTVDAFKDIRADIQIEFKLAKLDPQGNCTNGITRTLTHHTNTGSGNQQVNAVKTAQGNWPGDKYLNIYVAKNIGGAAGYTQYPSSWLANSMSNGIFVLDRYCGSIEQASYMTRHTLSHEVGHWLNLPHLWGSSNEPGIQSNCNIDDGVADTPNTMGWTTCNLQGSTCDGTLDNVQNFMEYSYCSTMFTLGQKARMHAALEESQMAQIGYTGRSNIWSEENLIATGVFLEDVLCEADFDSDTRIVCAGSEITFRDLSYSSVQDRQWEFEGGSPSTSTEEMPVVTYSAPGLYKVKLTVQDGEVTRDKERTQYIRVLEDGVSLPFIEGFESYANTNSLDDFWIFENLGNNNAFELTNEASYTGGKAIVLKNFGQAKGSIDAIASSPIDLSEVNAEDKVTLSFRYSHRKRSSANIESLKVFITADCGEAWVQRHELKDNNLSSQSFAGSWEPQSQEDWETVHMTNITSYYWKENFRVKFQFESDGGNNLYIDDINIYEGNEDPLSIIENELIQNFSVYPNPATDVANVEFSSVNNQAVKLEIVNPMGQVVIAEVIQANNGKNKVLIGTQDLTNGVYFVKVISGGTQQVKRLVVN